LHELARRLQRHALADAGDDVGERSALRDMHQHVVGGDQRRTDFARQQLALGERAAHRLAIDETGADPEFLPESFAQLLQFSALSPRGARHRDGAQIDCGFERVAEIEMTFALLGAQVAFGEQLAEPPIAGAVLRINNQIGRAVAKHQSRPDDDAHGPERRAVLSRIDMGAHHAGERVSVGDSDAVEANFRGARDHLFRVRGAAQERVIGHRRQFGEAGGDADHGRSPFSRLREKVARSAGRGVGSAWSTLFNLREPLTPTLSRKRERGIRTRLTMAIRMPPRWWPARPLCLT